MTVSFFEFPPEIRDRILKIILEDECDITDVNFTYSNLYKPWKNLKDPTKINATNDETPGNLSFQFPGMTRNYLTQVSKRFSKEIEEAYKLAVFILHKTLLSQVDGKTDEDLKLPNKPSDWLLEQIEHGHFVFEGDFYSTYHTLRSFPRDILTKISSIFLSKSATSNYTIVDTTPMSYTPLASQINQIGIPVLQHLANLPPQPVFLNATLGNIIVYMNERYNIKLPSLCITVDSTGTSATKYVMYDALFLFRSQNIEVLEFLYEFEMPEEVFEFPDWALIEKLECEGGSPGNGYGGLGGGQFTSRRLRDEEIVKRGEAFLFSKGVTVFEIKRKPLKLHYW